MTSKNTQTHYSKKKQNNENKENILKATGEKKWIMQTPFNTYKEEQQI